MNKIIASTLILFLVLSFIPVQATDISPVDQFESFQEEPNSEIEVIGDSKFQQVEDTPEESSEGVIIESTKPVPLNLGNSGNSRKKALNSDKKAEANSVQPDQIDYKLDINYDCKIDNLDFVHIQANYGRSNLGLNENGDVNNDGTINVLDFNILANNIGKNLTDCTPINPSIDQLTDEQGDNNGDQKVDKADYDIIKGYENEPVVRGYNGDFNCNGRIDVYDFNIVASFFNKTTNGIKVDCKGQDRPTDELPPSTSGGNDNSGYVPKVTALGGQIEPVIPQFPMDINMDCRVDKLDLIHIQANLGKTLGIYANGDVNGDGIINVYDFNLFAGQYPVPANETYIIPDCTPQDPFGNENPLIDQHTYYPADFNGDKLVDKADLDILNGYFGENVVPGYNGDLSCDGIVNVLDFNIWASRIDLVVNKNGKVISNYTGEVTNEIIDCKNKERPVNESPSTSGGNDNSGYVPKIVPLSQKATKKKFEFTGKVVLYSGDKVVETQNFVNGIIVKTN